MNDHTESDGVAEVRAWRKQIEDENAGKSMAELAEYIKASAEKSELRRSLNLEKAREPNSTRSSDVGGVKSRYDH